MRVTRALVCCLVTCLMSASIFGAVNQQKIYSLDSDVYDAIESLYIYQGLSLPSTTGPYSQAELSLMVEKIKASALQGSMKQTYEYVQTVLGIEPKSQGKVLVSAGALTQPWKPTLTRIPQTSPEENLGTMTVSTISHYLH